MGIHVLYIWLQGISVFTDCVFNDCLKSKEGMKKDQII